MDLEKKKIFGNLFSRRMHYGELFAVRNNDVMNFYEEGSAEEDSYGELKLKEDATALFSIPVEKFIKYNFTFYKSEDIEENKVICTKFMPCNVYDERREELFELKKEADTLSQQLENEKEFPRKLRFWKWLKCKLFGFSTKGGVLYSYGLIGRFSVYRGEDSNKFCLTFYFGKLFSWMGERVQYCAADKNRVPQITWETATKVYWFFPCKKHNNKHFMITDNDHCYSS